MKSQVSVLLVCMLFSKALSLTCNECIPTAPGPCTNAGTKVCPNQCLTMTMSTYTESVKVADLSIKTCGEDELCTSGSLDLGLMRINTNAKCCATDLCNSETLEAPAQLSPNGRMCYKCDSNSCSATLTCQGNEDHCISASVQQGSNTLSMKGCATKNFCASSGSTNMPGFGIAKMECCEGNLCNGAESFTLSFLLMMVPLLSSVLFY